MRPTASSSINEAGVRVIPGSYLARAAEPTASIPARGYIRLALVSGQ